MYRKSMTDSAIGDNKEEKIRILIRNSGQKLAINSSDTPVGAVLKYYAIDENFYMH